MNAKQIIETYGWPDVLRFLFRDAPFVAIMLLGLWKFPEIKNALDEGYRKNTLDMKEIVKDHLEASKLHDKAIQDLIQELKREKKEDMRLLIQLLGRANVTAGELQEAITAAEATGGC